MQRSGSGILIFCKCHNRCVTGPSVAGFGGWRGSPLTARFRRAVLAFSFFASTLSIDERACTDPLRHPAGAGLRTGGPRGRAAGAGRVPVHPRQLRVAATAARPGPSGSIRASAPPRSPTAATGTCSIRAAPDCRSRWTCRPSAATTPTTPSTARRSVASASPSTRWPTPRSCSTASRWTRSAPASPSTAPPRSCWPSTWPPPRRRACRARSSPAPSRTTSSRSTPRAAPGSGRRSRRCD